MNLGHAFLLLNEFDKGMLFIRACCERDHTHTFHRQRWAYGNRNFQFTFPLHSQPSSVTSDMGSSIPSPPNTTQHSFMDWDWLTITLTRITGVWCVVCVVSVVCVLVVWYVCTHCHRLIDISRFAHSCNALDRWQLRTPQSSTLSVTHCLKAYKCRWLVTFNFNDNGLMSYHANIIIPERMH